MSNDVYDLSERVQSLTSENRLRTALDEILALLDLDPINEEAHYLASLVIFLSQDPSRTYGAAEPLTEDYLGDTRFDALFCECEDENCCNDRRYRNTWVPNPMEQMLDSPMRIVFSPLGGVCPECGKVFCRDCARSIKSSSLICPQCNIQLSRIKKPNGRTSRQTDRRKEELKIVIVFREGPMPLDNEYLAKLFAQLSPDVLNQAPEIRAFPIFPWSRHNDIMLSKLVEVFCSQGISTDTHIIDHYRQFIDNEENHLYIVKIFNRSDIEISRSLKPSTTNHSEKMYEATHKDSSERSEKTALALLEIFRSYKSENDRQAIAEVIWNFGHYQSIEQQTSADVLGEILLQVSRTTDCKNEDLITALVKVGTQATFSRLAFFLRYAREHESSWRIAQKALIDRGKLALPVLLEFLDEKIPTDRKTQTLGRKRILSILAKTGDETCASVIRNIQATDNTVQEEAYRTLQAIEKRVGTLLESDEYEVGSAKFNLIPPTGDSYVDSCLTLVFSEIDDGREWNEYQELLPLLSLINNPGAYREALTLANSFKKKYRDFDYIYFWIAVAHRGQKHYDMACKVLLEGLQVCRRKYNLCNDLGLTEFETGNLLEAVKWWIQSLLLQEVHEEYGNHNPFLHLAYVSKALNLNTLSYRLFKQSDHIRPGRLRLVQAVATKIHKMVHEQENLSMVETLKLLDHSDLKFGK